MSKAPRRAQEPVLLRKVRQTAERAPKLVAGPIAARLLWADSLGAKTMSVFVQTPDVRVLIDPGASAMQPSFPLEEPVRDQFKLAALETIAAWAKKADVVVITHYHHDHYASVAEGLEIYRDKQLLVKDPNRWINRSQWHRARTFFQELGQELGGRLSVQKPLAVDVPPAEKMFPEALGKDFGSYAERRRQVLRKGERRLAELRKLWQSEEWLAPGRLAHVQVEFADGRTFAYGGTQLRFTHPLFHGVEYATVGWVLAVVVECGGHKLLFSSDLQGPTIEDYASWILRERPDVLILDGPPTYLFGQLVNRVNLERAIANAVRLAENLPDTTILYDHHLPRDPDFRQRMGPLFQHSFPRRRAPLETLAEWCGLRPLAEELGTRDSGKGRRAMSECCSTPADPQPP
ncbi:MAG: MBL fold metallo-hydrolase [candidate division KSB1 bacterium]|nr:MBL fold metallo-hydrolase [candidate division KSB1 bacterium]